MKNRIILCIALLLTIPFAGFSSGLADIEDEISNSIKSGNSKEIAKYFSSSVSISLPGADDTYQKAQGEVVLRDFFAKHEPISVKPLHKLSSNASHKYAVVILHTADGDFRVSFSLRSGGNGFELTEISIEPLKE
ncbi:MAG: hypothetical protein K0S09_1340 [Sphingobacteriaceae bacterium]|jgi:hypothetical protein|nr:hypothetical protein [Sphingobacteriaceae bacterium]